MPASQKSRKRKPSKSGKNRTSLLEHKKVGSELRPAFSQFEGEVIFSHWSDERLPEILWAAVIRVIQDQNYAISEFRRVIDFVRNHDKKEELSDLSLTGISKLNVPLRDEFLSFLLSNPITASALTVLLIFEYLPAKTTWAKYLPNTEPDINIIMMAIGMCIPHQSQEATDCRWLVAMVSVVTGKSRGPREFIEPLFNYPDEGDLRIIRPTIRTLEMALKSENEQNLVWSKNFWNEAWEISPCLELVKSASTLPLEPYCTREKVEALRYQLEQHWENTHLTTAIDAKHDCVFGIAFYSLTILEELLQSEVRSGILARLGLRTVLESYISLNYMVLKDDKELWKKWRTYGAGQAKLNALKFDEFVESPEFINNDTLESIACEDVWEEFINIELGSWSGLDLRKISELAGVKDDYDKYYSWTSTYTHATWGAVREACFTTCGNPLHRLHRYPHKSKLPDTLYDACVLVDKILSTLNKCYPTFEFRFFD